ncbi:MAG: hypothetical protein IKV82_08020 [Akkermansia sp.]|nr:hypothetical protein [Akkermansia sp.]
MSRRRSRKSKGGNTTWLLITIVALVVVLGGAYFVKSQSGGTALAKPQNFSIREYRNDGSRMAVPGNHYLLEGRIENIETIGNNRLISVSLKNNRNERLPLLVTKDTTLDVNLTRKDIFLFNVECRTGRDASGNEVKGILVVKNAKTVQ